MKPIIGSTVRHRRVSKSGVFNGFSQCGRYAVVKWREARKAVIVPVEDLRRVYRTEREC